MATPRRLVRGAVGDTSEDAAAPDARAVDRPRRRSGPRRSAAAHGGRTTAPDRHAVLPRRRRHALRRRRGVGGSDATRAVRVAAAHADAAAALSLRAGFALLHLR